MYDYPVVHIKTQDQLRQQKFIGNRIYRYKKMNVVKIARTRQKKRVTIFWVRFDGSFNRYEATTKTALIDLYRSWDNQGV